jgi:phosphoribosylglycinamide formyltransferase-1
MEASKESPPMIFVCATQILKSWWIEMTQSQLFNCHTAVLPYARGMYAIENIAILQDINQFRRSAGTTIHYVDSGVDTGAIIKAQRIIDPFQFNSIWDLKAYTYVMEFDLYVKTAQEILFDSQTLPAGIYPNPELLGPNFRIKDFTPEKQTQAEQSYLLMKSSIKQTTID